MDDLRTRVARAGVWLPYTGQPARAFFLPIESLFSQTLRRLCALLGETTPLGFAIDRVDASAVSMRWRLGAQRAPQEIVAEHRFEPCPDAIPRAMAALLGPLNESLRTLTPPRVVLVIDPKETWSRHDLNIRLLLVDPGWIAALRASEATLWGDEARVEPGAAPPQEPFDRLPLPEEVVPELGNFLPTGPYGQAFAALAESLALKLGLELRATPFPNRPSAVNLYGDERTLPLTIQHSFLQTTCRIDHDMHADGVLELLEEFHKRVDLENDDRADEGATSPVERKPYWLRIGPGSEQIVLATESEAEALRGLGYLREGRHRRRLLEAIRCSGEALPAHLGVWRHSLAAIAITLGRLSLIAPLRRPRVSLTATAEEQRLRLDIVVAEQTETLRTDRRWLNLPVDTVLAWILSRVNRALERGGIDYRVMIVERRALWLTLPWVAQFTAMDDRLGRYLGSSGEGWKGLRFPVPLAHPEAEALEAFATTRRPGDIVGKGHLLSGDFKCSCREEDFPSVFEAIAAFARVPAHCARLARPSDDYFTYRLDVTLEGAASTVILENRKYPDVTPILGYLNAALAADDAPRRLFTYRTPSDGGVLLADEAEAEELRHLRYIDDSPGA